jgi:hypothetical protein
VDCIRIDAVRKAANGRQLPPPPPPEPEEPEPGADDFQVSDDDVPF